ncbi:hypothetical protein NEILACOT_03107 [Neisseria lactamica ATCC 23970]|uniref:Uncharacterized protein n=1 Tax=Neisseria lactamica ATCC 23970 TaxID=546265 RepID=D0W6G9_NEILA|nr:hypothetical protein NEILACOT_03107 [Neisseria lactamica ATCC 23970]
MVRSRNRLPDKGGNISFNPILLEREDRQSRPICPQASENLS